ASRGLREDRGELERFLRVGMSMDLSFQGGRYGCTDQYLGVLRCYSAAPASGGNAPTTRRLIARQDNALPWSREGVRLPSGALNPACDYSQAGFLSTTPVATA